MELRIRAAKLQDAFFIASLTLELGYQAAEEEIKVRLRKISADQDQHVFIAENDTIVGWMHIAITGPLESEPFAEIRGIVVKKEFRGKGIGTSLISTAEEWAKNKGCSKLRVRTNTKRKETIDYYRKIGFVLKKKQEIFDKEI